MNNDIINAILSKEYNKAQELITESMNEKIGILLEEKLQEYAPTLFEAKTVNSMSDDGGEGSVLYSPALAAKIMKKRKAAAAAKKLDPVGKEDPKGDINNNGVPMKNDKADQVIMARRDAIAANIKNKK